MYLVAFCFKHVCKPCRLCHESNLTVETVGWKSWSRCSKIVTHNLKFDCAMFSELGLLSSLLDLPSHWGWHGCTLPRGIRFMGSEPMTVSASVVENGRCSRKMGHCMHPIHSQQEAFPRIDFAGFQKQPGRTSRVYPKGAGNWDTSGGTTFDWNTSDFAYWNRSSISCIPWFCEFGWVSSKCPHETIFDRNVLEHFGTPNPVKEWNDSPMFCIWTPGISSRRIHHSGPRVWENIYRFSPATPLARMTYDSPIGMHCLEHAVVAHRHLPGEIPISRPRCSGRKCGDAKAGGHWENARNTAGVLSLMFVETSSWHPTFSSSYTCYIFI